MDFTPDILLKLAAASLTGGIAVGFAVLNVGRQLRREHSRTASHLARLIETSRIESAEGRKRVHERIDNLRDHIDANYVRADVYKADQRTIQQAVEEANRIAALAAHRSTEPTPTA